MLSKRSHQIKLSNFTALGFDFGLKHLGVAVGQTWTQSANPLVILKSENGIPWEKIKQLIIIWKIEALVVGIPYNMDGSEQPITHIVRKFVHELELKSGLPVYTVDERLTTNEAKRLYFEQKFKKNLKLPRFDSFAAKLILEQWLQTRLQRG